MARHEYLSPSLGDLESRPGETLSRYLGHSGWGPSEWDTGLGGSRVGSLRET